MFNKLLIVCVLLPLVDSAQSVCDYALRFGGDGAHVNCGSGNNFNIEGQLTVEAWVKLEHRLYPQYIAGNFDSTIYAGFQLSVQNGAMYCAVRDSVVGTRAINVYGVPDSVWTHLAFTYKSGGRFKGYVNGCQLFDVPASTSRIGSNGTVPFVIGACPWNTDTFETHGWIDEVRVYNLERSISSIRQDMRTILNGPAVGLVGYWSFSEGNGSFTADASGYQRNGTLRGSILPVWQNAEGPYGHGTNALQVGGTSGTLNFPGTSLQLDCSGITMDTFVVTHIACYPNQLPAGGSDYTFSYWVVDRYGPSTVVPTDHFYMLTPGAVSVTDSIYPSNLLLYQRNGFSTDAWTNVSSASMASVTNATVAYPSVSQSGQFILATTGSSLLGVDHPVHGGIPLELHPNPANAICRLKITEKLCGDGSLTMVDEIGQPVLCMTFPASEETVSFNVDQLPSGIYQVIFLYDGNVSTRKLVVSHD